MTSERMRVILALEQYIAACENPHPNTLIGVDTMALRTWGNIDYCVAKGLLMLLDTDTVDAKLAKQAKPTR